MANVNCVATEVDKKALEAKTRTLEGVLRTVPETSLFEALRKQIKDDIAQTKAQIKLRSRSALVWRAAATLSGEQKNDACRRINA